MFLAELFSAHGIVEQFFDIVCIAGIEADTDVAFEINGIAIDIDWLVYDIEVDDDGAVHVVISLTSPGCPVAGQILEDARTAALGVEGVEKVEVELTFDPPWTPERISPLIRSSLGI